jgi:hypothetical protein
VPGAPAAPIADTAREPRNRQVADVDALNEAVLMARLRSAAGTDDALAIVLAPTARTRRSGPRS